MEVILSAREKVAQITTLLEDAEITDNRERLDEIAARIRDLIPILKGAMIHRTPECASMSLSLSNEFRLAIEVFRRLRNREKNPGEKTTVENPAICVSDTHRDPPGETSATSTSEECVVCMDHLREYCCVPCGHIALCATCANRIRQTLTTCPVCRAPYNLIIRTYR